MVIFIGGFVWRITKKVISLHRNQKCTQLIKGKNKKSPEHFQTKQRIKRTTMTEKERNNATKEVYKARNEADAKVREMRRRAEDKVNVLFSTCDDEDKAVDVLAIFEAKRLLGRIESVWGVLSSISPIVERLRFDGEADQFEELLEMVEEVTCDANADAYEINRIYYRVFGK